MANARAPVLLTCPRFHCCASSGPLMASTNRKYVCLPEYECPCRPRGKAVCESTMLNHRRQANKQRATVGDTPLPRGPKLSEAGTVLTSYESLARRFENRIIQTVADVDTTELDEQTHSSRTIQVEVGHQAATSFDGISRRTRQSDVNVSKGPHDVVRPQFVRGADIAGAQTHRFNCSEEHFHELNVFNSPLNVNDGLTNDDSTSMDVEHRPMSGPTYRHEEENTADPQFDPSVDSEGSTAELDHGIMVNDSFREWAEVNRKWIDFYLRRGLEQVFMDDIMETANVGYKSWKTVVSHMTNDSGLSDAVQRYAVCAGHMCYVRDPFSDTVNEEMVCSECGAQEPSLANPNTMSMGYIPILPRVRAMVRDQTKCSALFDYFRKREKESGWKSDVFDGHLFERICNEACIDPRNSYDVFIGASTDGFQVFEKGTCDVWPVIGIVHNLPPSMRFRMQNVLPFCFIPGSKEPRNLQSFLLPLIYELEGINKNGGTRMRFFDGSIHKVRVHLLWFTGDLPAIAKAGGLVGHNGKMPCRFCLQAGYYLAVSKTYYYPSKVLIFCNDGTNRTMREVVLCHLHDDLPRSEDATERVIAKLENMRGSALATLRRDSGIREDSVLFRLPTMFRYVSFPIDSMHLFYNVSRRLLDEIVGGRDEFFSLSRPALSQIDQEMLQSGAYISSQLGSKPRRLSLYKDWKSSEHKDFLLSYSIVFLDGHLPGSILDGWAKYVELADICHRPVISDEDIKQAHRLSLEFLKHFEENYYRFEEARAGKCKYVFHLLKHLAQNLENCGPLVNCSQLWVERYLGWVKGRLHARYLAPESLFKNALHVEAYKLYFNEPFREDDANEESLATVGDVDVQGPYMKVFKSADSSFASPRLFRLILDYFRRKYDGMTRSQAESIMAGVRFIQETSRVKFCCGSQVLVAGSFTKYLTSDGQPSRRRASWFIAAEMEETETNVDVYYGRLLRIFTLRFNEETSTEFSARWPEWKDELKLGLFDWASGLEVGRYRQVYKSTEAERAFTAPTIEDLSVIRRLISVVNHLYPSCPPCASTARTNSAARVGRKRCYFIDGDLIQDMLLQEGRPGKDGIDRNLKNILRRHD